MPKCRQCGEEFEPTAPQRRYCSAACRRRRWELANPLKKRASEWVWQCRNRSRIATVHRAWYLANRERALETSRLWTHLNRERKAAYQRERAERISTRKWSAEELAQVSVLLEGECAYCGSREDLTLDHVVPLSRGGTHAIDNLVAACKPCNSRKGSRDELEFRALLALEALIEGRRRPLGERRTPYRVRRPVAIRDKAMSRAATPMSGRAT